MQVVISKNGLLEEMTIHKCFLGLPGLGSASQEMADLASPGQSLVKAETSLNISFDRKLCGDWDISYDLWMGLYCCLLWK